MAPSQRISRAIGGVLNSAWVKGQLRLVASEYLACFLPVVDRVAADRKTRQGQFPKAVRLQIRVPDRPVGVDLPSPNRRILLPRMTKPAQIAGSGNARRSLIYPGPQSVFVRPIFAARGRVTAAHERREPQRLPGVPVDLYAISRRQVQKVDPVPAQDAWDAVYAGAIRGRARRLGECRTAKLPRPFAAIGQLVAMQACRVEDPRFGVAEVAIRDEFGVALLPK